MASCNAMGLLILLKQFRIHKLNSIGHLGNRLPAYTYTQTQLRIHELSTNEHLDNTYTQHNIYRIHKLRANAWAFVQQVTCLHRQLQFRIHDGQHTLRRLEYLPSSAKYTVRTCYTPSDILVSLFNKCIRFLW